MTDTNPKATKPRKLSTAKSGTAPSVGIVITVDHVYLPVGPDGNVETPWTASSFSPSRVLRRTHLRVPADLAQFLSDRDQAEITAPPGLPAAGAGMVGRS